MRNPLDHVAFPTWDIAATHDFYTKVMGWPLVLAWGDQDRDPPFFIIGFDAGGWSIEFEEQVGISAAPPPPVPSFPHFGLLASSDEELAAWKSRLAGHGVEFADLGTDLMFSDPNDVTFQLFRKQWHGSREDLAPLVESNLADWLEFRRAG